jgi:antitoxin CptB
LSGTTISSDGLDPRRRRLKFRLWHRGIREMDLVLGGFADAQLASLSEADLEEVESWLDIPDQQMFAWVNGAEAAPPELDTALFRTLRRIHAEGRNPK